MTTKLLLPSLSVDCKINLLSGFCVIELRPKSSDRRLLQEINIMSLLTIKWNLINSTNGRNIILTCWGLSFYSDIFNWSANKILFFNNCKNISTNIFCSFHISASKIIYYNRTTVIIMQKNEMQYKCERLHIIWSFSTQKED